MILQALNRYYEILRKDPAAKISPFGYSVTNVSFALNLSSDGEILDVLPMFVKKQRGKKLVDIPRPMIVPEQVKRSSGVSPNFLCDNSAYVFGYPQEKKTKKTYGKDRFTAFRLLHQKVLKLATTDAARAVLAYLESHDPDKADEIEVLFPYLEDFMKGGNIVFIHKGEFLHDNPEIRQLWEEHKASQQTVELQCLVTGQVSPIARLHPSLKHMRGAQPTGATLVGFNLSAFCSYNHESKEEKGLNAPVSIKAAFAYTTVLNYLLSDENPNGHLFLGDTSIVYWAESESRAHEAAFSAIIRPDTINSDEFAARKKADSVLRVIAEHIQNGKALDLDALMKDLGDENPRFYVLGLAPNAGRVSVRFFITDPFKNVVQHIMSHYKDLEIVKEYDDQSSYISVWRILNETVSKKARDKKVSPLLAGSVFRSILTGLPYPAALYNAIIIRIRADMDDKDQGIRKINYVRAAVIKAYLLRKYRYQTNDSIKEVLVMALNEQSSNPAYLLGRLFAVLEKVQAEAIGNLNASIKDRYFASACASPGTVFPILLRLAQHNIAKAEYGYASERRIQDILNKLDIKENPIPSRLTLDEQGVFILGYYHQRADFYKKREAQESEAVNN